MRVATYNIKEGGGDRLAGIARVIGDMRPDACAILEANDRAAAETLARSLGMHLTYGEGNSPFHMAWLTRLPPFASRNHRLPALQKTLLEVTVDCDGEAFSLFAAHLAAGQELGEEFVARQIKEISAILDVLRSVERPHLLVGDFNALHPNDSTADRPPSVAPRGDARPGAPRHAIRSILDAGYADCFRTLHPDQPGYTYPTDEPWLRLDYIFASPDMARGIETCEVIDTSLTRSASDHLPVSAVFHTVTLSTAHP